ncbi:hypothetical protein, partial [Paraburkholderia sp. BR14264]|uniref:hypothetical protein n=1 Tax=Paraburkholderia sp. BR14264 TaxID=3237001 RepID=UPI00397B8AC3
ANQWAAGVGAASTAAHLCGKVPGHVGLVCKVGAAVTIAAGIKSFDTAAEQGKCVAVTFSYPMVAQIVAGGLRVVKC